MLELEIAAPNNVVNYAEKYSQVIDEKFIKESLTDAAINKNYDFDGVNKVNVYSVDTVPTNRYGDPVELGNDVQSLLLTQDKAFTFSIDRRNCDDTMMANSASKALAREIEEVISPTIDKYRLSVLEDHAEASHIKEVAITTENAYQEFLDASATLFDARVPTIGRIAFVSPTYYKQIKLDKNFTKTGDKGYDLAVNGAVGAIDNTAIVVVPTDYFKGAVNFIITHPAAMTSPMKISDYKQHENPQGINGWLIEGRIYYDAFVLNNKKKAIYVCKKPTQVGK